MPPPEGTKVLRHASSGQLRMTRELKHKNHSAVTSLKVKVVPRPRPGQRKVEKVRQESDGESADEPDKKETQGKEKQPAG